MLGELLEKDWQSQVIDLARLLGWRVAHFRPAQTSKGWRTAVAADGAGFPDLVLVRDRTIFAELKREKGPLKADQVEWLRGLRAADAETYLLRPRHFDAIAHVLAARRDPLGGHLTTPRAREAEQQLLNELRKEIE